VLWLFLVYLLVWSFLVAAALMSAIGVTSHAMLPLAGGAGAAQADKIVYGIAHSLLAVALVRIGGYRLFDRVMSVCVGVMFVVVIATAVALRPPIGEFLRGLTIPTIPRDGASWTVALMGGIGGTVTVLCYGYWIREEGRNHVDDLAACRIDLAAAYVMTAIFGLGMVTIGSSLEPLEGGGARLMVEISGQMEAAFGRAGPLAKWALLIGAWAAVFTSLLGVWQSIPYLFADLWQQLRFGTEARRSIDTNSLPYKTYLYAIALVPIVGLVFVNFQAMMKIYAVVGALFIPLLALVQLILNGHSRYTGGRYRNSWPITAVLIGALLLFALVGAMEVRDNLIAAAP
jgi:Mn2+/Fe2+ NRAMP family transporter